MWISVQDALCDISSRQHFSASGQLAPREYHYFLKEEHFCCSQGRMFLAPFFRGGRRQSGDSQRFILQGGVHSGRQTCVKLPDDRTALFPGTLTEEL